MGCGGDVPEEADPRQQEASSNRAKLFLDAPFGSNLLLTCYRDKDADGFGDSQDTITAHPDDSCPAGYIGVGGDCADTDARAYPGQLAYFTTPVLPAGRWDFDCDGDVRLEYADLPVSCEGQSTDLDCHQWSDDVAPHWVETVPGCGETGKVASGWGCTWDGASCNTNWAGERVQACR
jgi:hypothetical protein